MEREYFSSSMGKGKTYNVVLLKWNQQQQPGGRSDGSAVGSSHRRDS